MNRIKFTRYWDKLNDAEFTTIRSWDRGKEDYYQKLERTEFQVWKAFDKYPFHQERVLFHAWLKGVTVVVPAKLPYGLLRKDVLLGGSVSQEWIDKILKMPKGLLLTFSKTPVLPYQRRIEEVSP